MDNILQTLSDIEGVNAALVVDSTTGQLVGYRAHSVYDVSLLQEASKLVANALDSAKLLQEDWNTLNAQFAEGRLLVRSLGEKGRPNARSAVLVVVADTRLNVSFAGVAIRVAVTKLKTALENGPVQQSVGGGVPAPMSSMQSAPQARAPALAGPNASPGASGMDGQGRLSTSEVAASGHSWSELSGSSSLPGSGISAADPASSEFLTACTKALAKCIGPMAKLHIKEAVRKICPDRPFSRDRGDELISEVAQRVSNPAKSQQFRTLMQKRG